MKYKRPKIVAELGVNANGDFELLKRMARQALNIGVDYVKVQTRTPEVCVPRNQWDVPRKWFDGTDTTYIEYKKRMELTQTQLFEFGKEFEGRWFTSVWDSPSIDFIFETFQGVGGMGNLDHSFFMPHFLKIPSAKLTDVNLVNRVLKMPVPFMISTGMSTRDEIEGMLGMIPSNKRVVIFHCNSSYPTDDEEVNLAGMDTLRKIMPRDKVEIGFSSHSKSPFPAIGAIYRGAEWVEAHYTLDRTLPGTDQAASLEDSAFELLVREAKRFPVVMGDGELKLYKSELSARKKLRG